MRDERPPGRMARMALPGAGAALGVLLMLSGGSSAARTLAPSRNVRGNPANEDLVARCTVPGSRTTAGAGLAAFGGSALARVRRG